MYNTVVLKDIFSRWKINNVYFFEILYKYIFASIGNVFTAKNITDYLKSQKIQISLDSVLNYLHYGEQAYLLFKVKTQDLSSKKQFSIYNKYYV
ncbi:ATP-binding protein [bacterium]|nr:ATP-binding protein [bacterium]